MTILTASLQQLLAGTSRSRRHAHLARAPASTDATPLTGSQSGHRVRQRRPIRNHRRHSALSDIGNDIPRQSRWPIKSP